MPSSSSSPARSVLMTGAGGLVGTNVLRRFALDAGSVERIVAVDLREPRPATRLEEVDYETADIRDGGIETLLRRYEVDTVIHLAAVVTPGRESSREDEYSIDVLGTENVVECSLRTGVRQIVYTSSGAAYGYHADNPAALAENDALRGNPEFAYSDHKRLVEEMLARYRDSHPELAQLIFRPGTILGPEVANQITAIFERPFVIGVLGTDAPFVFVWTEDVAACIHKGVQERRSGIYNLAGDGTVGLPEIARRLGKPYVPLPAPVLQASLYVLSKLGLSQAKPEQVNFLRYRPVLDNTRLKSDFGFVPSYNSRECFEQYCENRFPEHRVDSTERGAT